MINQLYKYLKTRIDFNNYYTIKKAMMFLESEYNVGLKNKDFTMVSSVLEATHLIYKDFGDFYTYSSDKSNTMSETQKLWYKKLNNFIYYLQDSISKNFNKNYNTSKIEDIINL